MQNSTNWLLSFFMFFFLGGGGGGGGLDWGEFTERRILAVIRQTHTV